jgi:hypothetical protein
MYMIHLYTKCYFPVSRENKIRVADTCHFLQNNINNRKSRIFWRSCCHASVEGGNG